MRVLYLGLSGVTHPSATTYHLVRGADPWSDGHTEYEAVPWLAHAMETWPDVQIVLTSTQPRKHGLRQSCGACRRWLGASSATLSKT